MALIPKFLIGAVAAIHIGLLYVEMFAWTTRGRDFLTRLDPDTFEPSKILAMNVGLYNGFLAAGLAWSLLIGDEVWRKNIALFFLAFIAIGGIFGAITADPQILLVQTVPAALAIAAVYTFTPKK